MHATGAMLSATEVSCGSWACGVTAAQFLAKVQVRFESLQVHSSLVEDVSQGQWGVRRAGCDPPESNLICGRG